MHLETCTPALLHAVAELQRVLVYCRSVRDLFSDRFQAKDKSNFQMVLQIWNQVAVLAMAILKALSE
jgi:hypothetical protein